MIFSLLVSHLVLLIKIASAIDTSRSNVAVYWGQNSQGSQERLSTYCQSASTDIILLSFLNNFPDNFNLNFANQCGTTFEDGVLHCPTIGEDIKTCQAAGKTVLLSLGGSAGTYGFTSDEEAVNFASTLWNKFGAGSDDERPFDDAVVDGFDFDIENGNQVGYTALANELRNLFTEDSSKSYYLSASPQCPYPDQSVGDLLANAAIDFAFIQFYNNYCSLDQNQFNWNDWSDFAKSAPNKDIKLFVGLPGGPASGSGYVDASVVADTISDIKCDTSLGGISIWDASSAWTNVDNSGVNYADQIKDVLQTEKCASTSSSSRSSSSTTVSSSSSSTTVAGSSSSTIVASSSSKSTENVNVISSSTLASSLGHYSNGSVSHTTSNGAAVTATASDIHTTVITVTSCSANRCSETPITTGVTVVTEGTTSYTTYCPLEDSQTVTDVSTTVITVTSCANGKCSPSTVTTGLTVVTDINTIYTTYCPLPSETSVVSTLSSVTAQATPVAQSNKTDVHSISQGQSIAAIETYSEGSAHLVTGSWVLAIAAILASLI